MTKAKIAPVVAAADRLRSAIERLSQALASGDAKSVLACELPLVDAVRAVRASKGPLAPADHARVRELVSQARAALGRCVQLGDFVAAMTRATVAVQGYGRRGAPLKQPVIRRTVLTRS